MNQYDAFDKETASYFTEDLHNSKAVSSLQYFADVESQFKKYLPASFFSNFQKGLGNLKFDHLYQFNQYPMQEFFNQFSFLKEEIERYKKLKYTIVLQSSSQTELKNCQRFLMNIALKLTTVIKVKSVKELSILLKETFVMVFILWMRILYSSLNMKYSKRRLNANIEDKILAMLKD